MFSRTILQHSQVKHYNISILIQKDPRRDLRTHAVMTLQHPTAEIYRAQISFQICQLSVQTYSAVPHASVTKGMCACDMLPIAA